MTLDIAKVEAGSNQDDVSYINLHLINLRDNRKMNLRNSRYV